MASAILAPANYTTSCGPNSTASGYGYQTSVATPYPGTTAPGSGYGYSGCTTPPSPPSPTTTTTAPTSSTPPPPPSGATSFSSGSSTTQSGTASATNDGTTASGTGIGGITVSQFSSDPVGTPTFSVNGEYFDIRVSSGNTFTSLTIKNCNLNSGDAVTWWNPSANGGAGAWEPVSNQTFSSGPPACVTVIVTTTSSPSLSQLTGTVLAVGSSPTVTAISPSSGSVSGGTTVTVTGTNFTGATAVDFGTTPAKSFNVVSSSDLSAVSPAGTGTVDITVTTPTGTSATSSADRFTYTAPVIKPLAAPGYWEVASDGGIFSFHAPFYGSMGGKPLDKPVVGMAEDPATGGYWEVASDGGIFSFHAPFYGSMGGKPLDKPVVGMAEDPATG
ncbi:MAG: IPT/TIG domain-containing protein, partial [Acidimicrobiales bacterium]